MSKKGLGLAGNDDGYVLAVGIALLIVSVFLVGYYVTMKPPSNATMTMYLLDSQGKASNYPDALVLSQNKTFDVQVGVENHMGGSKVIDCEIRLKVVNGTPFSYPVDAPYTNYTKAGGLKDGEKWPPQTVSVTIDSPGTYSVVFELWTKSQVSEDFQYSGYYCVLNVNVTL